MTTPSSPGRLIPHTEVDPRLAAGPGAYRACAPNPFRTSPTPTNGFGQLKAAAETTLTTQDTALDLARPCRTPAPSTSSSAIGRPLLIDTLSFERLREGASWVAYRQFCEHFLGPLAVAAYCDVRLAELSRIHSDGIPIDLVSRLLPRRTWVRVGLLLRRDALRVIVYHDEVTSICQPPALVVEAQWDRGHDGVLAEQQAPLQQESFLVV